MKESSTSKLVEQIIELLKRYGEMTSAEIARELGVNRRTVMAVLARLRREGVVEYLGYCFGGSRCNTRWKLKMN